jgi:hypothetical protein
VILYLSSSANPPIEEDNENSLLKVMNNVINIIMEKYSIILDESDNDDSVTIGVAFLLPLDNLDDTPADSLHAEIKVFLYEI